MTESLVLIIDDDADTRRIYGALLQHLGYRVLAAGDGPTGLQLAREARPSLVITDVVLPRLDGLEVIRRLRQDAVTAQVRVLVLSALSMPEMSRQAMQAGANLYLTKPAPPVDVAKEVAREIGEPAAH